MQSGDDRSLGDKATVAGAEKARATAEMSLGDHRTLGDSRSLRDTSIDDIEIVDLEARYAIQGTLGQGGMGAVLLATDTRLGRKVAIKRILGEAAGSRIAVQRFLTEAMSIAALSHPNIVQIYDYGRAKDGPFLVMEYVDGGSLLERCRDAALPLDKAVGLACQLCDGLAKAHDLGIVHRDIKPANVLLTKDGVPKLTDFGLAKAQASDHGQTMAGAVLGTPDFMPPEQRQDASLVDHRSDLWSLAATLYQMVTGRSPKIIRFDLLPAELTKVLGKALEDEKEARYQSVREFCDAIKTSVRVAAAVVRDVVEGTCVACGVQNDPSRKFCKGCGESLLAPCLACGITAPIWDEICGACGAKQTPLADKRCTGMAAKAAKAEGLLSDFEFDRAAAIAAELRDERHPRLKDLSGWATKFLEQTETARADQIAKAVESIRQATKYEAAHDHHSAVATLETVPASLAHTLLPGLTEPAKRMLDRIKQTQGEIRRLDRLIAERLAAKQLDELLQEVEKLLGMQPDREDIRKIRGQLVERLEQQAAARDEAVATAKAALVNHDYEVVRVALSSVAAAVITPEVISLREQAEGLVQQVHTLRRTIKDSLATKHFETLLPDVDHYLQLKPSDTEILALQTSIQNSIKKKEELLALSDVPLAVVLVRMQEYLESNPLDDEVRRFRGMAIDRHVDGLREELNFAYEKKRFGGVRAAINAFSDMFPEGSPELATAQALRAELKERRATAKRRIWIASLSCPAIFALVAWALVKASFVDSFPLIVRAILFCLAIFFGAAGLIFEAVIFAGLMSLDGEPAAESCGNSDQPAESDNTQVFSSDELLANAEILFRDEKFQDAAKVYVLLANRMPGNCRVWVRLAQCYARSNRWNDAKYTLLAVVPRFPDSGLIAYNLACYFTRVDDLPNAIGYLRKAIALESRYRNVALEDEDFESIRMNPDFQNLLDPTGGDGQSDGVKDDDDVPWNALLRERIQAAEASQQAKSFLYDPIEDDPVYQPSIRAADALAEAEHAQDEPGMGFCHIFWATKARILEERFGITWFSPAMMNPDTIFD
jgi:tetratricopeptide (TPR) repeat protein